MSEETWKFQSSFKTGSKGQNMHNVRGETYEEYVANMKKFADAYVKVAEIERTIEGVEVVTETFAAPAVAQHAAAVPAAPKPAPSPSSDAPVCQHGPMTHKSGSGAKGPWQAWMCPAPKADPSRCEPIWIR